MTFLSRILIVDPRIERGEGFAERLRSLHCQVSVVASAEEGWLRTRTHPDIMLVGVTVDWDAVAFGVQVKNTASTEVGIVFVYADDVPDALYGQALSCGLDDVWTTSISDTALTARVTPIVRLQRTQSELWVRTRIAKRFGVEPEERTPLEGETLPSLPVVIAVGRLALQAAALLRDCPVTVQVFEHWEEGYTSVSQAEVCLLLLSFDDTPKEAADFAAHARKASGMFNLPMVALLETGSTLSERAYGCSLSRVVFLPEQGSRLASTVENLVQRYRRHNRLSRMLSNCLQKEVFDPISETYDRVYAEAYLQQRLVLTKTQKRALSIVLLTIADPPDAAVSVIQKFARYLQRLFRAEDLVAYTAPLEFCIVLMDTVPEVAQQVLDRVCRSTAYAEFYISEEVPPVKVTCKATHTHALPGDYAVSLLTRARGRIL